MGLKDCIQNVFPDYYQIIIKIITYQIIEAQPLHHIDIWSEKIYDNHGDNITSQKVSRMSEKIGDWEFCREEFFSKWTQLKNDTNGIFFDITSPSSYSTLIELVEYGYNRDGDKLPQINFGVLFGISSQVPLLYSIYQGSISDVKTLHNLTVKLDALKLKEVTLILDRGFYSQKNIAEIYQCFDNFIIPMTFSTLASKNILEKCHDITDAKNLFYMNKRAIFHQVFEIEIYECNVYCNIFFDEGRKSREIIHLMDRLSIVEDQIDEIKFKSEEEASNFLNVNHDSLKRFFRVVKDTDSIEIERDNEKVNEMLNRMGKMILISKKNLPREKILELYQSRESIERCFDILKNELNSDRMRVKSRKTLEGRLFLLFLAIIVYTQISNTLKKSKVRNKFTVRGLFKELNKLKIIKMMNGKTYLSEISKKQRDIFKIFGIKPEA